MIYQFDQKKSDTRIIIFRLGRLQTLLLKNHIVCEVVCFPIACHIYKTYIYLFSHTGKTKEKPEVIKYYNDFMLGVDHLDQNMAYYSFLHKSVKWWRTVFFWLLEATVINRYIVYKEAMKNKGKKCVPHKMCRKMILNSLAEPMTTSTAITRTRNTLNLERLRPQKRTFTKI